MVENNAGQDGEIAAIAAISGALSKLDDAEARERVISYVLARYLPKTAGVQPSLAVRTGTAAPVLSVAPTPAGASVTNEIPGIARLTEGGELQVTIRDLKARSGLDAAVRLSYVAIYAHQKLASRPLSSPTGLTPLLKAWRLYDGNTRTRLAKDKGILRSGDDLSLDAHATRDAERFIQEILDEGVQGSWKPK
jgi:hypothetical protein